MERALPSSIDYTKILPIAAGNPRAMRRTYLPVNGQQFTSQGNNIVRIEISASQFLDPLHSYLRFDVTTPNVAATTVGLDYGGGHGFIRRLRLEQAGSIIMDCNRYDKLLAAILLPCQGGLESLAHRSITEQSRYNNTGTIANPNQPSQAAVTNGAQLCALQNSDAQINLNTTFQCCIPLVGGLFSQSKLIPLQLLSSAPLTIEIELSPPQDPFISATAIATNIGVADYTWSNVRYIASLVDVSPEVDAQIRMVQEMSGGHIVLNTTDYTHFNGNISAGATGSQAINVPARRKSMKSILFTGASQTFGADGTAAGTTQFRRYNQSFGGHFNMVDYHAKIGQLQYPATPVLVNANVAAGPVFSRGEALMELSKCFGTTGSVVGTGILSRVNYATTDCDVAGMAITNAAARFSPFGLDLEAFQRTAIESGVNTADRSTPITLVVNIGAPNAEAINVDCFVSYDALYYIDSSGIISVSQ